MVLVLLLPFLSCKVSYILQRSYLLYDTCSIESASVVGRTFMYDYSAKLRNSRCQTILYWVCLSKHLSSPRVLTTLSSVNDDWFIHPHWGELELDTMRWNTISPGSKIVGNIFRKSLRLSGRARNEHNVGQITTMISSDATHLDLFTGFAHQSVLFWPLIIHYWSWYILLG